MFIREIYFAEGRGIFNHALHGFARMDVEGFISCCEGLFESGQGFLRFKIKRDFRELVYNLQGFHRDGRHFQDEVDDVARIARFRKP